MRAPFVWIALSLVAASGAVPQYTNQRSPTPIPSAVNLSDEQLCKLLGYNCVVTTSQLDTTTLTYPPPDTSSRPASQCPLGQRCVNFEMCGDSDTFSITLRSSAPQCNSRFETCCRERSIRNAPKPTKRPPVSTDSKCGHRNRGGVGINITGTFDSESKYGEFPWMVAVTRLENNAGKTIKVYQCGGSLIHPQVVLTAAHSVYGKDNLMVRAGDWDIQSTGEQFPVQDRYVTQVVFHDELDKNTAKNGLALLILDQPMDLNLPNVGLICLPDSYEIMDYRDCVASGWGKDARSEVDKFMNILKKIQLPMVPTFQCQEALRKTSLGPNFNLHESFVCAGGIPGRDTCKGDGGSPLACPSKDNPDVYVQAGIVAWGVGCGTAIPAVYVNVPGFVNWIENKMQSLGIYLDN